MVGQTTHIGLTTQAIGQYFSYRLLVIPAVALLMMMTTFVSLRSHRIYPGAARDTDINLGQDHLETDAQANGDFAFATWDTNMPRGDGRQQPVSGYAVQVNDEDLDLDANTRLGTGSYLNQGTDGYSLWSAVLTHAKEIGFLKRVPTAAASHPVSGAAAA